MDYGEIELKKISYDVISVTSSLFRHQIVTKLRHKIFLFLALSNQNFWLRQSCCLNTLLKKINIEKKERFASKIFKNFITSLFCNMALLMTLKFTDFEML